MELFAIPIRQHTDKNDICYEPFAGSGTQLIAAESLNRNCYAMELSPPFVGVALERGQVPDRKACLTAHPEFAAELEEFFAGRDCLERLTTGLPAGRHHPGPATDLPLADFRLLREIGRGGMGIVYEARQISLNRQVALKVLPFAAAL